MSVFVTVFTADPSGLGLGQIFARQGLLEGAAGGVCLIGLATFTPGAQTKSKMKIAGGQEVLRRCDAAQ